LDRMEKGREGHIKRPVWSQFLLIRDAAQSQEKMEEIEQDNETRRRRGEAQKF